VAHISRKELKKDEFRETVAHSAQALLMHRRTVWIAALAAAFVLVAIFGWRFYSERQTVKASAALERAMEHFNARIRALGEPQAQDEISYVDEKNKYQDAATKFTEVVQQYGRTRPGQIARYYAGLSYLRLGQHEQAERWFRETERSGDAELAALARFQLAQFYARTGKPEEAVRLYQALAERPTTLLPKPVVLLALAEHHARSHPAEARRIYEQVRTEFPDTAAAQQAEQRLQLLAPGS
jgi:TolA-binding protein